MHNVKCLMYSQTIRLRAVDIDTVDLVSNLGPIQCNNNNKKYIWIEHRIK